jgi:transmembrane sensor
MTKEEIQILTDRITSGMATEEEILLFNRIYNALQPAENKWHEDIHGNKEEIEASVKNEIWQKTGIAKPVVRMKWYKWAAAAILIGVLGAASYLMLNDTSNDISEGTTQNERLKNDVAPGGNKAVLTLADGSIITLDDARNDTLTQQGSTKVIKFGAKLVYDPANTDSKEVVYNTITTPRGGMYQIELPDGSQVWINSASSLRFPTAFVGGVRKVEITGEAYFEIAKNRSMPFVVSVNGAEVQVLGTHFNVMYYGDENAVKTTLLEGSVRFVSGNDTSLLKPGQQSQMTKEGKLKVVDGVDVESIVAWKKGLFYFDNADIGTVMRQLARWYDVEVVYETKEIASLFVGKMPRSLQLSEVLKALEISGDIKFRIEGKRIIVMQ